MAEKKTKDLQCCVCERSNDKNQSPQLVSGFIVYRDVFVCSNCARVIVETAQMVPPAR